jgi:hypothetical protein
VPRTTTTGLDKDGEDFSEELILSNYFSVRDGKIVSLVIVFNQSAATDAGAGPGQRTSPGPGYQGGR